MSDRIAGFHWRLDCRTWLLGFEWGWGQEGLPPGSTEENPVYRLYAVRLGPLALSWWSRRTWADVRRL